MVFVSFPSLKDPQHNPGPSKRHTGQFMVLAQAGYAGESPFGDAHEPGLTLFYVVRAEILTGNG